MKREAKRQTLPLQEAAGRRLVATILQPLHEKLNWKSRRAAAVECAFPYGLRVTGFMPEEKDRLTTARADFAEFFHLQKLASGEAEACRLETAKAFAPEEHEIRVSAEGVVVRASDTEGVRRALHWIEDEMMKRGGPFLPRGRHRRKAVIKTRISRCFFGPINRPPAHRDELLDEVDYYPDAYLNRLAHDGVNVLWITIKFRDTVPSQIFPEFAPNAGKRLGKLQQTVEKCARYGIRVFVFCIEPDSLPVDSPIFVRHPELKGHVIDFRAAFCTSTALGKRYLTEATKTLFASVPGLGGMIVIPVGERFTHCYSIALPESGTTEERCNCPRCGRRSPHDVLHDTLAALRRGMDAVDPKAELIAWPYGQSIMWGEPLTAEAASHLPAGVTLQHNFETGCTVRQLGRDHALFDYWLSVVGPSPVFQNAARRAQKNGSAVSAKLQVGCSHEDATVPFVSVPGLLHAKYARLHRLGVSAVMQSWFFGNYPSLMTRAAGLLSFGPFPKSEGDFLIDLATRDWGREASRVAKAWTLFRNAYENYPATHFFGYYGPVQDGLVWPLHLVPRNRPLTPTWKLGYPPSGDYLADCLSSEFTLSEALTLCRRMSRGWNQGLKPLGQAYASANKTINQQREWNVARAIGLQFESCTEILAFYQKREALAATTGARAVALLSAMEAIVRGEVKRRRMMITLCVKEPTLGFHPEAEGFKFTPALLRRGLRALERLLKQEFPKVRQAAARKETLFPDYTGKRARSVLLFSETAADGGDWNSLGHLLVENSRLPGRPVVDTNWRRASLSSSPLRVDFQASQSGDALSLLVRGHAKPANALDQEPWISSLIVDVEPRRLHPRVQFSGDSRGYRTTLIDDGYLMKEQLPFTLQWERQSEGWTAMVNIPLASARLRRSPALFRFNVRVTAFNRDTNERLELSWAPRQPLKARQGWDDANPARDYGWAKLSR